MSYNDRGTDGVEIDFSYIGDTNKHVLEITYNYDYSELGVNLIELDLDNNDTFCNASLIDINNYSDQLMAMEEQNSYEDDWGYSDTAQSTYTQFTDEEIYMLCTPYIEKSFSKGRNAKNSSFEFDGWVSAEGPHRLGVYSEVISATYKVIRTDSGSVN